MKKILFITFLLVTFLADAQEINQKKCATTAIMEYEIRTNPEYKSILENYFYD